MAVDMDHVHIFIKYGLRYSVSFITREIKRRSRIMPTLPTSERMVQRSSFTGHMDIIMARWVIDGKLWRYISGCRITCRKRKALYTGSVLKCGV